MKRKGCTSREIGKCPEMECVGTLYQPINPEGDGLDVYFCSEGHYWRGNGTGPPETDMASSSPGYKTEKLPTVGTSPGYKTEKLPTVGTSKYSDTSFTPSGDIV